MTSYLEMSNGDIVNITTARHANGAEVDWCLLEKTQAMGNGVHQYSMINHSSSFRRCLPDSIILRASMFSRNEDKNPSSQSTETAEPARRRQELVVANRRSSLHFGIKYTSLPTHNKHLDCISSLKVAPLTSRRLLLELFPWSVSQHLIHKM